MKKNQEQYVIMTIWIAIIIMIMIKSNNGNDNYNRYSIGGKEMNTNKAYLIIT